MALKEWETDYYKETDRAKRKAILDKAVAEEGMTPENELRMHLYDSRYGDSEKTGREVDYFIRGLMTLEYLKSTSKFFLSNRKMKKELDSIRKDWQFEKVNEYGESGQEIIYHELRNLTLLYIQLCRRDKAYQSVAFGLGHVKEKTLSKRVSDDIYRVAYILPAMLKAEEELEPFTRAATLIFCEEFPEETDAFYERVKNRDGID